MQKFRDIKNSWTVRNFQLVIILGLLAGILIQSFGLLDYLPKAEAITYVKPEPVCLNIDCEIMERTNRIYTENQDTYKEQARLEAIREINIVLQGKVPESPYVDYEELEENYGY